MDMFPRWIYHVIKPAKMVYDENELEQHLNGGWSLTFKEFTDLQIIQSKIAETKNILKDLEETEKKIISLMNDENENTIVEEISCENDIPIMKKRGRPKKVT